MSIWQRALLCEHWACFFDLERADVCEIGLISGSTQLDLSYQSRIIADNIEAKGVARIEGRIK